MRVIAGSSPYACDICYKFSRLNFKVNLNWHKYHHHRAFFAYCLWRTDIYDGFIFGWLFNVPIHCTFLYVFQVSDIYEFLKKRWLQFTVVNSQYLCTVEVKCIMLGKMQWIKLLFTSQYITLGHFSYRKDFRSSY